MSHKKIIKEIRELDFDEVLEIRFDNIPDTVFEVRRKKE